jgi:hypothetical protein
MYLATLVWPMPGLRSSPWILGAPHNGFGDAHLADQPANFQRYSRSAAAAPRFPAPAQSETGAAPTDHGIRLHNRQRLDDIWHQTIQPDKDQAIHGTEGKYLRLMPSLDVKLMTKDQVSAANETCDRNNDTRPCCKLLS